MGIMKSHFAFVRCVLKFVGVDKQHYLQRQKQNETDNTITALIFWCSYVTIVDVESNELCIFPVGVPRLM